MNDKSARQAPAIERHPIIDRASWLELRLADVTASDVPAVCGIDRYRTALAVWAEKTGAIGGMADNAVLRRGRWGEAAVIEMLHDERPSWEIQRTKVYLRDPAIRLGATPDAIAIDPERPGIGAVQCKTVRKDIYERDWPDGEPPLRFQLQNLTEAMLAGASWRAIVALVMDAGGGWEPAICEMARHEAAEARIRDVVVRFWSELEAGHMPPVYAARDSEVVEALYPKAMRPDPLDLSADNLLPGALVDHQRLKGEIKLAETRIGEIETDLKAKLGTHELAVLPAFRITWKNSTRKAFTMPAWEGRRLTIKEV